MGLAADRADRYRRPDRQAGERGGRARALRDAEMLHPDLCILGACGIAAEIGVTALYLDDAEFKRVIAGRSRSVVLAITSDKLDTVAAHDVVPLEDVSVMAVEDDADEAALAPYAASGMKIVVRRQAAIEAIMEQVSGREDVAPASAPFVTRERIAVALLFWRTVIFLAAGHRKFPNLPHGWASTVPVWG